MDKPHDEEPVIEQPALPEDPWRQFFIHQLRVNSARMDRMQASIEQNASNVQEIRTEMAQNTATTVATKKDTEELISLWNDIKGTVRMATGLRSVMVWIGGVSVSLAGAWLAVKAMFHWE